MAGQLAAEEQQTQSHPTGGEIQDLVRQGQISKRRPWPDLSYRICLDEMLLVAMTRDCLFRARFASE